MHFSARFAWRAAAPHSRGIRRNTSESVRPSAVRILIWALACMLVTTTSIAVASNCIDYRDYLHLKSTVGTPGNAKGIVVAGSYAYVADGTSGLRVLDISNVDAPVFVGGVATGDARNSVVVGNLVYLADGSGGFRIIDVANPAAPQIIGSTSLPGLARTVDLRGNYAYVTVDNTGPTQIVDVSNPAAPTIVGSSSLLAGSLWIDGNYAYAVNFFLRIYDLSNPLAPVQVGSFMDAVAADVLVRDGVAYLSAYNGVYALDVSNPAAPAFIQKCTSTATPYEGLWLEGTHLFVPVGAWGVDWVVHDVASAGLPVVGVIRTTGPSASSIQVAAAGGRLLVPAGDLAVLGIENPVSGPLVQFDTPGSATDVAMQWPYAYVADTGNLRVLDLSNPETPVEIGSLAIDARTVAVQGTIAFVGGASTRSVVNIGNPASPTLLATLQGGAQDVDLQGSYAYSTNFPIENMNIIDVTNPALPVVVSSSAGLSRVVVDGAYAYGPPTPNVNGVRVVDVSGPTAPSVVGEVGGQQGYTAVKSGDYVFTDYNSHGVVSVFDVKDPSTPVLDGTLLVHPAAVGAAASFLYVLSDPSGFSEMLIIDLDQQLPSYDQPKILASIPGPVGGGAGIAVDHGLVLAAAGSAGILIYRGQCEAATDAGDATASRMLDLRPVWPNPSGNSLSIGFALPEATPVDLQVFDVAGRRVRQILSAALPAGPHQMQWDGRDDAGRRVGSGVYVLRLRTAAATAERRVTLLR